MELTLTVLMASALLGFVFPQRVRSRPHLILGSAAVALALLMLAVARLALIGPILGVAGALAQAAAFVLLICAAGGFRLRQWLSEIGVSFGDV